MRLSVLYFYQMSIVNLLVSKFKLPKFDHRYVLDNSDPIKTLDELEDLLQTYNMIYDNFELYGNNSLDDIDIKYNIKKLEKSQIFDT